MPSEIQIQREYYTRTAAHYNAKHAPGDGEHDLGCAVLESLVEHHKIPSILDVGSGTGRAVARFSSRLPHCQVMGIEPVEALRRVGYANGLSEKMLVEGDATKIAFPDNSFGLVCEFGVLHHIPRPRQAVAEMIRVCQTGIFISDSNRFGMGSSLGRVSKLALWKLGLWPAANWLKTKGKGYTYSEGDGVAYSYSVFDDYNFIAQHFKKVLVFNLDGEGDNALLRAPHVGLFAIHKKTA
jgi:ubiquinone/menaquinone biosynthesis C-methylase UbiE